MAGGPSGPVRAPLTCFSIDARIGISTGSGGARLLLAAQVVGRGAEGYGDDLQAVHARLPCQVLPRQCVGRQSAHVERVWACHVLPAVQM